MCYPPLHDNVMSNTFILSILKMGRKIVLMITFTPIKIVVVCLDIQLKSPRQLSIQVGIVFLPFAYYARTFTTKLHFWLPFTLLLLITQPIPLGLIPAIRNMEPLLHS